MNLTPIKFRLNEFQAIGRWVDKNLPPLFAWIVKSFVYGLEDRWIDAKVQSTLNKAEAAYRASEGPFTADTPIYTETRSEVEGLNNISITAPWIPKN